MGVRRFVPNELGELSDADVIGYDVLYLGERMCALNELGLRPGEAVIDYDVHLCVRM